MIDNTSRRSFPADQDGVKLAAIIDRSFPADQDGVKLAAIIDRYHKGSRASSAWKMHALDGISWIVENAIR